MQIKLVRRLVAEREDNGPIVGHNKVRHWVAVSIKTLFAAAIGLAITCVIRVAPQGVFRSAVVRHDIAAARACISRGADVNSNDEYGLTALMYASGADDTRFTSDIIGLGANPRLRGRMGQTALHYAATLTEPTTVRLLLKNGAVLNAVDCYGRTPLIWALRAGPGASKCARELLSLGAKVNQPDVAQRAALSYAMDTGDCGLALTIAKRSNNCNVEDETGQPILLWALDRRCADLARYLVKERGADVNLKSPLGQGSVATAVKAQCFGVAEDLLVRGADPNLRSLAGEPPIVLAAASRSISVIRSLLRHGASVDSRTRDGITALMESSSNGDGISVLELLQHRANISLRSQSGMMARDFAAKGGHREVVRILESQ